MHETAISCITPVNKFVFAGLSLNYEVFVRLRRDIGILWMPLLDRYHWRLFDVGKQRTSLGFDFGAAGTKNEVYAEGQKSGGIGRKDPLDGSLDFAWIERTVSAVYVKTLIDYFSSECLESTKTVGTADGP